MIKKIVLLSFLGYAASFPVLPIRFFLPHQEVDEFGAPIHHSILADDDQDFYNYDGDHNDDIHAHDTLWHYDEESAHRDYAKNDPSINPNHIFYSHTYGIEPEVNFMELDPKHHQEYHQIINQEKESLFSKTHSSHGFDSTMDFVDMVHHDHLHHQNPDDGFHHTPKEDSQNRIGHGHPRKASLHHFDDNHMF